MTNPWCLPITPAPTSANLYRVLTPCLPLACARGHRCARCARSCDLDPLGVQHVGEGLPGAAEQVRTGEPAERGADVQVRLEGEEPVEPVVAQRADGAGDLAVTVARGHD